MKQAMRMYIDSHCHLQLSPIFAMRSEVINRAIRSDVSRAVVCGVHPRGEDWARVLKLHAEFPSFILPQIGLHPWWISGSPPSSHSASSSASRSACSCCLDSPLSSTTTRIEEDSVDVGPCTATSWMGVENSAEKVLTDRSWLREMEALLQLHPLLGVGECGLDKSIKKAVSLDIQELVLIEQLKLAQQYSRPVSLHCVGSWGRLLKVVRTFCSIMASTTGHPPDRIPAFVLHSCSGMPVDMIVDFSRLDNVYFSVSAAATETARGKSFLLRLPLSRLLLETDSPDQPTRLTSDLSTGAGGDGDGDGDGSGVCDVSTEAEGPEAQLLTSSSDKLSSYRCTWNEPHAVRLAYANAATALGIDEQCLIDIIHENFCTAFKTC